MWAIRRYILATEHIVVQSTAHHVTDTIMSARPFTDLEHRWGHRLDVTIPVQFNLGLLKGMDGRLRNVSWSGGLMTAHHRVRRHSLLEIVIRLSFSNHAVIEAHVTRASNDAVGLEWCPSGSAEIKALLKQATASARSRKSTALQTDWRSMYPLPFDGDPDAEDIHGQAAAARR